MSEVLTKTMTHEERQGEGGPTNAPAVLAILFREATRDAVQERLAQSMNVTVVGDVSEAAPLTRASTPDIVLLDLTGQSEDAVLVYHRVKALLPAGIRRVPVVVIGTGEQLERLVPVLEPIDDILFSPTDTEELLVRLQMRVRGSGDVAALEKPHTPPLRYSVLVVDDTPANVTLLVKYLENDYDVCTANDGPTALVRAAESHPDLILLDVRMPGMSGYEVCEALRRHEATRLTPVIMVTASADDRASKIHGLETGADDFLVKPIHWPELSARVRNLIRVKSLTDENRRLERERERIEIMREVIFAVTGGKLELTEEDELTHLQPRGRSLLEVEVLHDTDIALARNETEKVLLQTKMDPERVFDMVLCVSEATTNAVKHAGGGILQVYQADNSIHIWMRDRGKGIDFSLLPRSTLMKGWSSKLSLGCGFTIMLEMLDRLRLTTSRYGTTVIMEMRIA